MNTDNTILHRIRNQWWPTPVNPPTVDPSFPNLSDLQRATESWRYCLLCWEHWVSPNGNLREWLKHNIRVAAYLTIPAVLFIPLLIYLLTAFTTWSALLEQMAKHFLFIPAVFFGVTAVFIIVVRKILLRR